VDQFVWSPDGKRIAFAATDSKPEAKGEDKYRDAFAVGDDDFTLREKPRSSHIWIIDSAGGDAKRLTSGTWSLPSSLPPGSPSSPLKWSADGKSMVFVRQETPSTGDQQQAVIEVLDVASGKIRKLTHDTTLEGYPVVSPDGNSVAYWRNRDGDPWKFQGVLVAPFGGGAGRDISKALDKNIYGTWWLGNGKNLLVGANDGTSVGMWVQPADGGAPTRLALGAVMPTNGYWIDADVGAGGEIAFIGQNAKDPYELYVMANAQAKPEVVTAENQGLEKLTLGRTQTISWQGPGGRTLNGVVTYPPGFDKSKTYPMVLTIHGGPNSASRERFGLMPQVLAGHGWIVFEPNYRGSDNMDGAFFASIYQDAGQGPGEDVISGVKYLEAKGFVDSKRLAVTGWSYGGFMTTWMLAHYPIWKAGVAGAAVTDWVDMYNLSDGNITTSAQVGGSPYTGSMESYRKQSPDSYITAIKAPTLVMCDTGDFRVPITQSFGLYRALRDNHVETQFYAYPVGGHFPGDPIRQMDVDQRWVDWVSAHLR